MMLTKLLKRDSMTRRSLKGSQPYFQSQPFSNVTSSPHHCYWEGDQVGSSWCHWKVKMLFSSMRFVFIKFSGSKFTCSSPSSSQGTSKSKLRERRRENYAASSSKIAHERVVLFRLTSSTSTSSGSNRPSWISSTLCAYCAYYVCTFCTLCTLCARTTPLLRNSHRINWDDQGNIECAHYSNN